MGLFWKIFVSVGLAITLTLVGTLIVSFRLAGQALDQVDFGGRERIIQEAADALAQGGERGLRWWLLNNPRPAPGVVLLVLDEDGSELVGRALPLEVARLLRTRPPRPPTGPPPTFRPVQLPQLVSAGGDTYRLLFWRAPVTVLGILTWPRTQAAMVTIAMLVAAAMSLLLARYLSAPIIRLQRASRALAAGSLDTRVGPPSTRRKDEVGQLARDFDAMAERLQALVADKETLLRDVSHEFRSPLARIRVALALAQRSASETAQTDLKRIEQESERLNELVGQVMTLSRLRSRTDLRRERVRLDELLDDIVEDARFEHPEARIDLHAAETLETLAEPGDLKSAVENVVRNALAYSGTEEPVEVRLEKRGQQLAVRVLDRGPGVPEEDLGRIFEPFYRADASRDQQQDGQGIGLAIAARVMELHGGGVRAHNRPDGGLEVVLWLPASGDADAVPSRAGAA
jgi:two-component system, OmpR family, sensor kinase